MARDHLVHSYSLYRYLINKIEVSNKLVAMETKIAPVDKRGNS